MACDTCTNGDLTTIQFTTSGFTGDYTLIGGPEITREIVDATVLGESTCRQKCPGDKIDWGEVELELCFNPDEHPPYDGDSEPIIITWPPLTGQTNGATFSFDAWIRRYKVADAQPDERMLSQISLVIDCSETTPVFSPGS